jgi:hypothetical protein
MQLNKQNTSVISSVSNDSFNITGVRTFRTSHPQKIQTFVSAAFSKLLNRQIYLNFTLLSKPVQKYGLINYADTKAIVGFS